MLLLLFMPTATLPETDEREKIQVLISKDAATRLRIAAAVRKQNPGEVISDVLSEHLPAAPKDARRG